MTEQTHISAFAVANRASCLIARAEACVTGFQRAGQLFSADLTQGMVDQLEAGSPPTLWEHWIAQQEARLSTVVEAARG